MIIHKFGGAAVKDAKGVRNLAAILNNRNESMVVVISAFGKTTNKLEELTSYIYSREETSFFHKLQELRSYHFQLISELFTEGHPVFLRINEVFQELEHCYSKKSDSYDHLYDQVVSKGEIISTLVIQSYLQDLGFACKWVDIRNKLITDNTYREATILWEQSHERIADMVDSSERLFITQGFIAGDQEGFSTTLGREGSDYTAAILGNMLNAEEVIIWKDVPGVLNADPRYFEETKKLDRISYREAIELAYYGAKIIHPKTIKPLQNKDIPLYVKSFLSPDSEGTIISQFESYDTSIPVFIVKKDQMLISILPKDFSFIFEQQISNIYQLFAEQRVKVNLMQHSAITFTVAVDRESPKIESLQDELKKNFRVLYNAGLELITVRHYTEEALKNVLQGRKVLVEQRSRHTAQFILKDQTEQ